TADMSDAQCAGGLMNGFVTAQSTRGVTNYRPMGHYDASVLPYYWSVAKNYVLFDDYFASSKGGSLQNHMYWVTGTEGTTAPDAVPPGGFGALPTIFDRLDAAGVSWKFYIQDYEPDTTFRTPAT